MLEAVVEKDGGSVETADVLPRCAGCSRPLDDVIAICPACEAEDARQLLQQQLLLPHACPACAQRFDEPVRLATLPPLRWFQLRRQKYVCPHCSCFILSRQEGSAIGWLLVFALAFSFLPSYGLIFGAQGIWLSAVVLGVAAVLLPLLAVADWRAAQEEKRWRQDAAPKAGSDVAS